MASRSAATQRLRAATCPVCAARGRTLQRGEPLSLNLCHWGSNICRAGWIAATADDLPEAARDYVAAFAGPYFEAMAAWFTRLRIGTPGGDLHALVAERLPFERFGVFLNPGHLIHLDEWLSSPIYRGSTVPLRSGMALQVDVIPSSPVYGSTRMEDGVVLADVALRRQIATEFPNATRCQHRRGFTAETSTWLPERMPIIDIITVLPATQPVFALVVPLNGCNAVRHGSRSRTWRIAASVERNVLSPG
jgi:hypothetical protein